MLMPWGKYRGVDTSAIPSSYLCWVLEEANSLTQTLRVAILDELSRRFGGRPAATVPPAVCTRCGGLRDAFTGWYRRKAMTLHPDHGGSEAGMRLLNDLRDELIPLLR